MDAIEEALGEYAKVPIEPYVKELGTSRELPLLALGLCTIRYDDSGPFLRAALRRAADAALIDNEDERLFFRALFIIGGRRDPLGFEPLLRLLRRPKDEVEDLLGDVDAEVLPQIAAGMFNGNVDDLFDAIADLRLDEVTRNSLLGAATFLTWDNRIDREHMIRFLRRFDADRLAPEEDVAWYGWQQAVALLGLRELEPAVIAAWDRGSVPPWFVERKQFIEDLQRAEKTPDDIQRFKDAALGYIDDVQAALESWVVDEDEGNDEVPDIDVLEDLGKPLSLPGQPAFNPWRHVGRNDPCPCGSGKKAKRCCLAA